MYNIKNSSLVIILSLILTSCAGDGQKGISKQGGGAVLGAVAGGLLGSTLGKGRGKLLGASAGALIGAFAGSQVGKSLDAQDKMLAEKTSQNVLESQASGSKVEWKNPDTGNSGSVTPTRTFKNREGRYCREYTQEVKIGDQIEKAYGTACRQPDGHWKIISTQ